MEKVALVVKNGGHFGYLKNGMTWTAYYSSKPKTPNNIYQHAAHLLACSMNYHILLDPAMVAVAYIHVNSKTCELGDCIYKNINHDVYILLHTQNI